MARIQFELTLQEELSLAGSDTHDVPVRTARYFLGDHLLRMGEPEAALRAIEPALGQPGDFILRMIEAQSRRALGQISEALTALRHALDAAKTDKQRDDVRANIAEVEGVQ